MELDLLIRNARTRFSSGLLLDIGLFQDMETLYDLITTRAAQALGIEDFGLEVGNRADLVLLDAESVWKAIWTHKAPLCVLKSGCIVSR